MADKDDQIVDESEATNEVADKVTEEDLAKVKAEAESQEEVETTDEVADETSEAEEQSQEKPASEGTFTKKFTNIKGDTPDEYARNLEIAYENSTAEYQRLRSQESATLASDDADVPDHPAIRYAASIMERDAALAFNKLTEEYPQALSVENINKLQPVVDSITPALQAAKGRPVAFEEVYFEAAKMLGWEKSVDPAKEKLGAAVKESTASSKTNSAVKSKSPSKVTDEMISINRAMYPDKTDAEIREELEPFVK